ncbi:hypothetical protein [Bradyrhizobium sp. Tv2a-2]|uniref:hypothetical protein n=1 Tax=Bradyrhizobium sp. Tv2a-2 TaxID=113395 RepID=UPI0003F7A961|nr:hypothetical protein [Bradyrhizobium sp. Tv2a-2]
MSAGGGTLRVVIATALPLVLLPAPARSEVGQVNTIKETIERIYSCWRAPPLSRANPMDITVIVSFNRAGQILGKPRITFETAEATDNDRVEYRVAVMEALQRCTPMPFTESMAGAAAGHPFWIRFHTTGPKPQPTEKRAWLLQKIL